jgi:homoserine dehydrogenase
MKLVMIGFGVVGQGLVEILRDKRDDLQKQYGFTPHIVGVATRSRGSLLRLDGLDPDALLTAMQAGGLAAYPEAPGLERGLPPQDLMTASGADVMVETSYTNLDNAQPALDYCRAAFNADMHVVMANKGPVALAYDELAALAAKRERRLLFEATVMAGTPSLRLALNALAGCEIREARGILNGTTNYILTQMEGGMSYEDALAEAKALGYAEADPRGDVDGWDAAAKALIVARSVFGAPLRMSDLEVSGISAITLADVEAARANGERWKLIAHVTATGGSVRAQRVPVAHPLAGVSGTTNAITYTTDLLGDVTLVGPGAGRHQTGFGLLADLLNIHNPHLPGKL